MESISQRTSGEYLGADHIVYAVTGKANHGEVIKFNHAITRYGEDTALTLPELGVFGVFDGAGGGGEDPALASQKAAYAVRDYFATKAAAIKQDLQQPLEYIRETNLNSMRSAMKYARTQVNSTEGAGITTALFAWIIQTKGSTWLAYANAGDCRLGIMNESLFHWISKERCTGNIIHNGLGRGPVSWPLLNDEFGIVEINQEDRLLLCSDGITGDFTDERLTTEEISEAFQNSHNVDEIAKNILGISKKRDDKSIIVLKLTR